MGLPAGDLLGGAARASARAGPSCRRTSARRTSARCCIYMALTTALNPAASCCCALPPRRHARCVNSTSPELSNKLVEAALALVGGADEALGDPPVEKHPLLDDGALRESGEAENAAAKAGLEAAHSEPQVAHLRAMADLAHPVGRHHHRRTRHL